MGKMDFLRKPELKKYAKINKAGREAVTKGEITRFEGFPPNLEQRLNTAALPDDTSQKSIQERIVQPLGEIATSSGITMAVAGKDYPLHSTLLEGLSAEEEEAKRKEVFKQIMSDPSFQDLLKQLIGLEITYKYILIDKGNVLLTSDTIPQEILTLRAALSKRFAEAGLKPLQLEHILHMSIARMTGLPTEEQQEKFAAYKKGLVHLRHAISKDPIVVRIGDVFNGSAYQLLTQQQ